MVTWILLAVKRVIINSLAVKLSITNRVTTQTSNKIESLIYEMGIVTRVSRALNLRVDHCVVSPLSFVLTLTRLRSWRIGASFLYH